MSETTTIRTPSNLAACRSPWPSLARPGVARVVVRDPAARGGHDEPVPIEPVDRDRTDLERSSPERIDAFARYWLGFDNRQTVAIHSALKQLEVPTLIVWGLKDIFFDKKWAYWLKDTIPGAKGVIEVEDGRLFFPEDLPETFAPPLLQFWEEWSKP